MIKDLFQLLQQIQNIEIVQLIVPGRIKPAKGQNSKIKLSFTTETDSGLKFIAKSDRAVQEVFIVTNHKDELLKILKNNKIITE